MSYRNALATYQGASPPMRTIRRGTLALILLLVPALMLGGTSIPGVVALGGSAPVSADVDQPIFDAQGIAAIDGETLNAVQHQKMLEHAAHVKTIEYAAAVEAARQEAEQEALDEALRKRREEKERWADASASATGEPTAAPTSNYVPTGNCGGWEGTIAAHFPADQVGKACRVMMCESGGNPTAANPRSTASGLFQFLDSTWVNTTGTPAPASAYSGPTQVAAAAKLWRSSGWSPWVCT